MQAWGNAEENVHWKLRFVHLVDLNYYFKDYLKINVFSMTEDLIRSLNYLSEIKLYLKVDETHYFHLKNICPF